MKEAVIFDMDGTLLNTLEDLTQSVNSTMQKFGFQIHTKEEIRKFVGNGVRVLFDRALPKNISNEIKEKCIEYFKKDYSENMYSHTGAYKGILEILKELKNSGYKIAVVSNKFDKAVKELSEKYFRGLIDVSIGQSDDVPQKPAPNGVFKAMRELGIRSAVYVGDSDVDVQTAKNANLPSIGVTWGFRDKENLFGADIIVDSPEELLKQIRNF